MRIFLSCFLLFFLAKSISVFAQDQCAISLSAAEDKYEQGRLYEISAIIEECLKEGFTDEEKVRAYRLLTLTYLYLNYQEKADSTFLKLLNIAPDYKTNDAADPMELIYHSEKFTTKPIFYLNGKVGLNFSLANKLLDYSLSNSLTESGKYTWDLGFIVGVGAEMVIWKDLHLAGELFYSRKSVRLSDTHFGFYTTNMEIIHRELEVPLMLKYNFFKGKVNPFCFGGLSPSFLAQSSSSNISGNYLEEDETPPVNLPDEIVTTRMKNKFNYSVLFGGGINYKFGLNYLVFEARYSIGMLNVTNNGNRFNLGSQRETPGGTIDGAINEPDGVFFPEGRELKFPPGHIDDDFKLNNLSILVGFVRPLYKPRKIK